MSFMYSMNKSGPSRKPCGTPAVIVCKSYLTPSTTVTCFCLLRYDLKSSRHLPSTETASNFASNPRGLFNVTKYFLCNIAALPG